MWFNADKTKQKLKQLKKDMPPVLANQAQRFFVGSFKKQGFEDETVKPWIEVNRRVKGTPEYKYPKKKRLSRRTKNILVSTGRLRRDVNNSIKTVSFRLIRLRVNNPYAKYHNFGTDTIPQRRFMGNSATLRRKQLTVIKSMSRKIFFH